ncbi:MAG: hypothetical protein J7K62_02535 [Thermoplasmata archaeon]|nr:hypothetical protein [Thermoplasmata archaeon]
MATYTGIVGALVVSGQTLSGADKEGMEATITIGKERGKFNAIGTDVSQHTTGMKTCDGTVRRKWVSGDTLFQSLMDGNTEFEVTIEISGQGQSITASGCVANSIVRRVAPGTEVMTEEMSFTGRDWY